jgi:hypothetical protein
VPLDWFNLSLRPIEWTVEVLGYGLRCTPIVWLVSN